MSDFLSNLVARTMAQPTLRPRTRSRFEAPAIEEAPLVWPETTRVAEPEPGPPAERFADPPTERGHPARPPEASRPAPQLQAATPKPPAPPAAPVTAPTPSDKTPDRGGRDGRAPIVETTERVVRVPAARPHRFDEQPPHRIVEREIQEVRRDREVIHTTTRATRPQRVAGKSQPPAAAAQPEPVIQVSIGRIEVRAVPSAPPPRNAPRNAAMTIDDYVAKRKAKERR